MVKYLLSYFGLLIGTSYAKDLGSERYSLAKIHFAVLSTALLLGTYVAGGGWVLNSLVLTNILIFYGILRQIRNEMILAKPTTSKR